MKRVAGTLIVLAMLILIGGCDCQGGVYKSKTEGNPLASPRKIERIDNVVRVFMTFRNGRAYTLAIQDPGSERLVFKEVWNADVLTDVPVGESMWAKTEYSRMGGMKAEVHVHSVKNIEGGSWHDKSGEHKISILE